MKIVLITHQFLPEYSSGTEILTYSTAKAFQNAGHIVEIITGYPVEFISDKTIDFDSYEYDGLHVKRYFRRKERMRELGSIMEGSYHDPFAANWFKEYLNTFKPDIVHAFHLALVSASVVDVCVNMKIPIIFTPTDFWFICPRYRLSLPDNSMCNGPDLNAINCLQHIISRNYPSIVSSLVSIFPNRILKKIMISKSLKFTLLNELQALNHRAEYLKKRLNMFNRVIIPSKIMQKKLVANGLEVKKIIFSRYGINIPKVESEHKKVNSDKLRVGFIGTLSEHKGPDILIRAIRNMPSTIAIELKIYGDHSINTKYIKQLFKLKNKDQRIHFCGTFENDSIDEIFSELDVLVVPSTWYENTPLVIFSAQAAKTPIIATDLGGMSEVIKHEENGLLVSASDVTQLSEALLRLHDDRDFLKKLSTNVIPPKSSEQYALELLVVYNELMSEHGLKL